MIRLLTAVLLFASFHVAAEVTLTDINNNEVADADEVMGNFNALKQGVEANATAIDALPTPPTNCTTDQIIKWDGSAWVCASKFFVQKICNPGSGYCEASCLAGTTVVSGGCSYSHYGGSQGAAIQSTQEGPLSDLSAWSCYALSSDSVSLIGITTKAICQ